MNSKHLKNIIESDSKIYEQMSNFECIETMETKVNKKYGLEYDKTWDGMMKHSYPLNTFSTYMYTFESIPLSDKCSMGFSNLQIFNTDDVDSILLVIGGEFINIHKYGKCNIYENNNINYLFMLDSTKGRMLIDLRYHLTSLIFIMKTIKTDNFILPTVKYDIIKNIDLVMPLTTFTYIINYYQKYAFSNEIILNAPVLLLNIYVHHLESINSISIILTTDDGHVTQHSLKLINNSYWAFECQNIVNIYNNIVNEVCFPCMKKKIHLLIDGTNNNETIDILYLKYNQLCFESPASAGILNVGYSYSY